ncbi:hypothetical protein L1987_11289 [Smallanthus sonchifolius]|uniref:Uncharacterized protein n=1 Tax=Smallanthus sonchifolius TaxID=185202 RepID=A0ACB9JE02_9ASTR|nr:hypothetical protein L1987_11289 [Smallanthus sonchifolius]
MADSGSDSTAPDKSQALHPVYTTVTNIQNKVRILDGIKVTYSSWVKLFKLHAKGYKVSDHIDGTNPPVETDPTYASWAEIDAIVLQWIYGTLSDDLLARILDTDASAHAAWVKLQEIFLNNKGSRAAALENEFTNLSLAGCSSMDEYCQKLKAISEQLSDVDQPVSESRLVFQLVLGLPFEYDGVATFINQSSPAWDVARNMIQLEQQRQAARQNAPSNQSVLMTSQANATGTPLPTPAASQQQQYAGTPAYPPRSFDHSSQRQNYRGRGRGRNSFRGGRNAGGVWVVSYILHETREEIMWLQVTTRCVLLVVASFLVVAFFSISFSQPLVSDMSLNKKESFNLKTMGEALGIPDSGLLSLDDPTLDVDPNEPLDKLLLNKRFRLSFMEFADSCLAGESVHFYNEVQQLEKIPVNDHVKRIYMVRHIIEKYISTGAPMEVNISHKTRQEIITTLDLAHPYLFRNAVNELLQLMNMNLAKDYWSSIFFLKFKEEAAMRSVDHELEQVNGWTFSPRPSSVHCPDDPFYQDHVPRDPPSHDGHGSYLQ